MPVFSFTQTLVLPISISKNLMALTRSKKSKQDTKDDGMSSDDEGNEKSSSDSVEVSVDGLSLIHI